MSLPLPPRPISTMDLDELYRLPYDYFGGDTDSVRNVVPSVKFSRGYVDRNRYYVDLSFRAGGTDIDIASLGESLRAPDELQCKLAEEFARFRLVRFVGAGQSHGRMTFRVYLGFSGTERYGEITAISADWDPLEGAYQIKNYRDHGAVARLTLLGMLRNCLCTHSDSQSLSGASLRIYELCSEISRKAQGALHITEIEEPGTPRHSVAFNYFRCAHTSNAEIKSELDALAEVLELPPNQYESWLHDTRNLALVDIAAGTDWRGNPFVTVYHGFLYEPPAFIREPKRSQVLASTIPGDAAVAEWPASLSTPAQSSHESTQFVYALGRIGFTYPSDSRRNSIRTMCGSDPDRGAALLELMAREPFVAATPIWTLKFGEVPAYAIVPEGTFAELEYARLGELLHSGGFVAVPGRLAGKLVTWRGDTLSVIVPELRGMTHFLADASPTTADAPQSGLDELQAALLDRLISEAWNAGFSAQHRARNFALASIQKMDATLRSLIEDGMEFASLDVTRSVLRVSDRELWEVQFIFFHPNQRLRRAKLAVLFTVDVADVVPRGVGSPRIWHVY